MREKPNEKGKNSKHKLISLPQSTRSMDEMANTVTSLFVNKKREEINVCMILYYHWLVLGERSCTIDEIIRAVGTDIEMPHRPRGTTVAAIGRLEDKGSIKKCSENSYSLTEDGIYDIEDIVMGGLEEDDDGSQEENEELDLLDGDESGDDTEENDEEFPRDDSEDTGDNNGKK